MKPSIGRIVHYRLAEKDIRLIEERRERRGCAPGSWNYHQVGQVLPMLIVLVHGDHPNAAVNGQVFLDGDDSYHVVSCLPGEVPGTYAWPVVPPAEPIGVAYGDRQ